MSTPLDRRRSDLDRSRTELSEMRGHLLRQSEASSVTLVAHRARHHHSSSGHGRSSSSRSHALVVAEKRVAAAQIHTAHAELETVHAEMNQVRVCNEALSLTVERLRERCAMQERSNESQTEALITVETRYSAEIEAMASAHAQSMASAVAHAERRLDDMHASRFRALADGHNVAIQKVVRVAVLEKQRAIRNGVEAAEHSAAAALDAALVGIRAEHAAACEGVRRDLMERQLEQEHQLRETYRVDLATAVTTAREDHRNLMRAAVDAATEDAWAAAASDKTRAVRTVADESQHRQATVVHDTVAAATAQLRGDFAATSEARAAEHAATIGRMREAHDVAAREAASAMQRCEAGHQEHVADIMARGQEAMMACEAQNDSAGARHRHLELDVADLQAANDRLADEANLRAREAHDAACVAEAHTAAVAVMEQTLETRIMELQLRNTDLLELGREHTVAAVETAVREATLACEAENVSATERHRNIELDVANLQAANDQLVGEARLQAREAHDAARVSEAHTAAVAVRDQTLETQIMELQLRNTDLVELARVHATVETTADGHQVHAEALELRIAELECINASLLELGKSHVAQAADATQVEVLLRQRIAEMVHTASDQAMVHTASSSSLSSSSLSASSSSSSSSSHTASLLVARSQSIVRVGANSNSKTDTDNNLRKSPISMPSYSAGSDDDTDIDRLHSADVADVHEEDVDQMHLGRRLFCETRIEEVIAEGSISLESATNSEENVTIVGEKGERLKECVSCKTFKKKVEFAANQWKKAKARPPTCKACTETNAAGAAVRAKAENTDDLDDTDFLLEELAKLSPSKRSANPKDVV